MATAQTGKSRTTRKTLPVVMTARSKAPAAPVPIAKASKAKKSSAVFAEDVWRHMVATAAYYRAQARDFRHGSPEQDWLAAEAELKQKIGKT